MIGIGAAGPQAAMSERRLEAGFLDVPSAQGALDHSRFLNQQSHYPGSPGDRQVATYMRDKLRDYGFEANLEEFKARIDTPKKLLLEFSGRPKRKLDLTEAADPSDPDTAREDRGIPFNYGSGDGDVIAPVVYVNRGLENDYALLTASRIPVRGNLVLIRYGAQFRGLLAKRAQDHGAAGVIFYSDPKDDGFVKGKPYPNGPYRPESSVQRGSVQGNEPGPLRIPTLPISAINARTILAAMTGRTAPQAWHGALDVPYVAGMTQTRLHLTVVMNRSVQTIWNTVGKMIGSSPSQSVILGGHRDAWVYGVTDNGSGISTLLEAARGLGYLHRSGWRPVRTIVIAGWDAEEIGELGSKAYVQVHEAELRSGCVAYVNADENVSGPQFGADAAAGIAATVVNATKSVRDNAAIPVFDTWQKQENPGTAHPRKAPTVRTPGGGSDHEAFLYELGIPTAQTGFFGPFGAYHSAYDDLAFASEIADPEFTLHRTAAQLLGILAMRLAQSERLPYQFSAYVPVMRADARAFESQVRADGQTTNSSELSLAMLHFAGAARRYDRRQVQDARAGLQAAQLLDLTIYGRNGYESAAFPKIAGALAQRNSAAIAAAFAQTAASIDRAAELLR
ncbi:MAG: M28 family peptidase [Candidatus Eremiobacteraeota bacterium]|nr:M28 family peptidase [Candidatus Eremiobacteraeota bacterium]